MARSKYKIYEDNRPHFLTCTIINWIPLFNSPKIVNIIFESLRFLQDNNRIKIYAYVVMITHLHLIASSPNLSKEIGIFKSFTAREIIDFLKERNAKHILKQLNYYKLKHKKDRDYQVWEEGFHPKMVQDEKMLRQKVKYIHNNPVKSGFVDDPVHWRYSSARNYAGLGGMLEIDPIW